MHDRLGLNLHRDAWPTAQVMARHEEAGVRWLQVHTPPAPMLADRARCRRHARALRAALEKSSLRLVLHAPDDLSAGTIEDDRAFAGLLDYAAEAGAELVAYHGLNFVDAGGPDRSRAHERARLEEGSLLGHLQRAHTLGVTIAVENLAPVYPSPPTPPGLAPAPVAGRALVPGLAPRAAGMLLDVAPLHITADASHSDPALVAAAVAPDVVLFHVHDTLGVRRRDIDAPGVHPLKLDLHLPPGRGSLPWGRVAAVLREHSAPLLMEVEPSQRPALAELTAGLLRALAAPSQRAAA